MPLFAARYGQSLPNARGATGKLLSRPAVNNPLASRLPLPSARRPAPGLSKAVAGLLLGKLLVRHRSARSRLPRTSEADLPESQPVVENGGVRQKDLQQRIANGVAAIKPEHLLTSRPP